MGYRPQREKEAKAVCNDADRQRKLLIVDNDDRVSESLQKLFRTEGFDTRSTWSGREALALMRSQSFDVLLVGNYLPDLYYGDFLQHARRQSAQLHIIVMKAGKSPSADLRRHRSLGVTVVDRTDPAQIRQAFALCCSRQLGLKAPRQPSDTVTNSRVRR